MSVLEQIRQVIRAVPKGRVITYGGAARAVGRPRAARLTVWALHHGEGLPWHRVVAAGGRIALPGAEGLEQRLRLEIEGVTFRGDRVRMERHEWAPRVTRARDRSPRPRIGRRGPGPRLRPAPRRATPSASRAS